MSVIELTGSTSVVFVDTRTTPTTVLLPPLGFQSRFITIKDSYGNAHNNPITVSTSSNYFFNGAGYKNADGLVANVSTVQINQNYASITVASAIPNTLNPTTTWVLQNTFAFEDRYPIAYVQTVNSSNAIISSISTTWLQSVQALLSSSVTYNAAIQSAQVSSLNVTDWLKVGSSFIWAIPSSGAIGIGAYPSTGWALDVVSDARIRSSLSVQQMLVVGTSNLYVQGGRAGIQCNDPRYTADIGGELFVASTIRAGKDLLVQSSFAVVGATGRTAIGNSTGQAFLDVFGDMSVRSSMGVASTFTVGQSTFGVLPVAGSAYVNGWFALNAGTSGVQPLAFSTSGVGTMLQAGSNVTQGSKGNLFITGWGQANQDATFSFLSSGQLGVNCNAPQTWLDVKGSAKIDGTLTVSSGISTVFLSAANAYIGDTVGSTIQMGSGGFINNLSSASTLITYLSAGTSYLGNVSAGRVSIDAFSIGRGYVGLAANESLSSQRVSAGQAYIGGLSAGLISVDTLSSGSNYLGFTSAESISSTRQSTGTSFIGILSSLSVSVRSLVGFSALFSNLVGLNVTTSSLSTYSLYAERASNAALTVSSIGVGATNVQGNQLYVAGKGRLTGDLTVENNLQVGNQAEFSNVVNCRSNVNFNGAGGAGSIIAFGSQVSTIFDAATAIGVGTTVPRTGLDVQTFVNMSSANIGVLSTGSLQVAGAIMPRLQITGPAAYAAEGGFSYSLYNEQDTRLAGTLRAGRYDSAGGTDKVALVVQDDKVAIGSIGVGTSLLTVAGNLDMLNNDIKNVNNSFISTLSSGRIITNDLYVGNSISTNVIRFRGTYKDNSYGPTPELFTHTVIGERLSDAQGSAKETSELILFKGNDADSTSGPDRVRVLAAGGFAVDTYSSGERWPIGGNPPAGTNRFVIDSNGQVGIGTNTSLTSLLTVNSAVDNSAVDIKFNDNTFLKVSNDNFYANRIEFNNYNTANNITGNYKLYSSKRSQDGYVASTLQLYSYPLGTVGTPVFTIAPTGNITIGGNYIGTSRLTVAGDLDMCNSAIKNISLNATNIRYQPSLPTNSLPILSLIPLGYLLTGGLGGNIWTEPLFYYDNNAVDISVYPGGNPLKIILAPKISINLTNIIGDTILRSNIDNPNTIWSTFTNTFVASIYQISFLT